jgi:hypothetical protein
MRSSSLPVLPAAPQPTEGEIASIICSREKTGKGGGTTLAVAELIWRCDQMDNERAAFNARFPTTSKPTGNQSLNYTCYFESETWALIHERVMKCAGHLCQCCGSWAEDVHIRDWQPRVLMGTDLSAFLALCRSCRDYVLVDPATEFDRSHDEQEAILELLYGQDELATAVGNILAERVASHKGILSKYYNIAE